MAVPKSILITGCNRGYGLELVKQLLNYKPAPSVLIATCRNPGSADELNGLAKKNSSLKVLPLDVTDFDSYGKFVKSVTSAVGEGNGLNLLINNAGAMPANRSLHETTAEDMMDTFKTNCVAPLMLTRAVLPLLKTASGSGGSAFQSIMPSGVNPGASVQLSVGRAAVINISTAAASITDNEAGNSYAYRVSKTAMNQATRNLSHDLKELGILAVAMHPGWVKTDMGGSKGLVDGSSSAATMIDTLTKLSVNDHGTFLRYNNTPMKW